MALAIVATVGGATSNSYVTLAEANTYLADSRLDVAEWDAFTDDQKNRALYMATVWLDQLPFVGTVYDISTPQALQWPRIGTTDARGVTIDYDEIPTQVKRAQMELALHIAKEQSTVDETGLEAFEYVSIGDLAVRPRAAVTATSFPDVVRKLLGGLVEGDGGTRVWRG